MTENMERYHRNLKAKSEVLSKVDSKLHYHLKSLMELQWSELMDGGFDEDDFEIEYQLTITSDGVYIKTTAIAKREVESLIDPEEVNNILSTIERELKC